MGYKQMDFNAKMKESQTEILNLLKQEEQTKFQLLDTLGYKL